MIEHQSEQAFIVREYVTGRRQVEIARELGISQAQVCVSIERFCRSLGYHVMHEHYGPHRKAAARGALVRYTGEFKQPAATHYHYKARLIYEQAKAEHVWLLRAEGLTLKQIGDRIGVSRERAREIVAKFSWRVQRATRRTRWRFASTEAEMRDRLAASEKQTEYALRVAERLVVEIELLRRERDDALKRAEAAEANTEARRSA